MQPTSAAQLARDFSSSSGVQIRGETAWRQRKKLLDRLVTNGVLTQEKVDRDDYTAINNARVRRHLGI